MYASGRPIFSTLFLFINVGVFIMWSIAGASGVEQMAQNFTVSWKLLSEGRYWTVITSVFSHNLFIHLLVNMLVLRSFGNILEESLGSWRFLKLYLFCGVTSSLVHSAVSNWLMGAPDLAALGASGALAGLVLVFALLFPREKILIFGLIPMPALIGAFLFIGLDIWGLVAQVEGGGLPIGHGAHLGGAFAGIVYYVKSLRPDLRR